jgi:Carboxymuconolactone decarboxylase family
VNSAHAHVTMAEHEDRLLGLALCDISVIRTVTGIDPDPAASTRHLDAATRTMVALAASVSMGGSEVIFGAAVEAAFAAGADSEDIAGLLVSLVPIVGLAKVRDAAGTIVHAMAPDPDVQRRFIRVVSDCPVRLYIRPDAEPRPRSDGSQARSSGSSQTPRVDP